MPHLTCSSITVTSTVLVVLSPFVVGMVKAVAPTPLEQRLLQEDPAILAAAARQDGDVQRGAAIFYRADLACAKCHDPEPRGLQVGPNLAKPEAKVSDNHWVESVLSPSQKIRKGYETVVINLVDGRQVTGLLDARRAEAVHLKDTSLQAVTIPVAEIESETTSRQSVMPAGLVNQLANRQEFIDLVRYLMEIGEAGPDRAAELRPPLWKIESPLPAYEKQLDHAGMIGAWDSNSLKRGEVVYRRLCITCHGTIGEPGSLPTSLKFAEGRFKNGCDPLSIYQTLTHGFGMMAAQPSLVPQQKYDVIHFIREHFLKTHNRREYFEIDAKYLSRLPTGSQRGPPPIDREPWSAMDYGSSLMATYEVGDGGANFAYKGIAVRLDSGPGGIAQGKCWIVYDHDTLNPVAGWTGSGFIAWTGINFNGQHQVHPKVLGRLHWSNPIGPGWANPKGGSFSDERLPGRDGRRYGPLPQDWARFRGLFQHGNQNAIFYTVGNVDVIEAPGAEFIDSAIKPGRNPTVVFTRNFQIDARPHELLLRVAPLGIKVELSGDSQAELKQQSGFTLLRLPPGKAVTIKLFITDDSEFDLNAFARTSPPSDLKRFTIGGPRRWPQILTTTVQQAWQAGAFSLDWLEIPLDNPWNCQIRLTGLDFFPDGDSAAVCTWDGDVWLVRGLSRQVRGDAEPNGSKSNAPTLTWQRIAAGLFQPLGLKIVHGAIYVGCRDQIVLLRDFNGDGETDLYECFNSDHQVTEHFHEFAMGLQTDEAGNFYYAKAARHALPAVVPQHGTLLRVSQDGSHTDIVATGFRAPNGVCVNSDGTFFVTDQEGHWTPKNRINWVQPGGFYGNLLGYHDLKDSADTAMNLPVCWITNDFDRSPAEILRVDSPAWGPLKGSLLNLSYGTGKVFIVPHEKVNGRMQGGMCQLPLPPFPTGIMRGRFHPLDGNLYVCGMYAWAGNATQPGGFYRIKYTGAAVCLPVELHASARGLTIVFSEPLDPESIAPQRFSLRSWSLKRTANYGSPHFNERPLSVDQVSLGEDRRTVFLKIPEIQPTECIEIKYSFRTAAKQMIEGVIHNSIHDLME